MTSEFRIEKDSLGEVKVPKTALYGAQTQRALNNFPISGICISRPMIHALGLIKQASAKINSQLGNILKAIYLILIISFLYGFLALIGVPTVIGSSGIEKILDFRF